MEPRMMDIARARYVPQTLTNLDFARKFKTDGMYDGLGQVDHVDVRLCHTINSRIKRFDFDRTEHAQHFRTEPRTDDDDDDARS
jgi:hypothetical protein